MKKLANAIVKICFIAAIPFGALATVPDPRYSVFAVVAGALMVVAMFAAIAKEAK